MEIKGNGNEKDKRERKKEMFIE
jgi:hypothetical protein